jgi:hypothetical protein
MVNIFLSESPLPPLPRSALGQVRWVAARILGRMAQVVPGPADHSKLLPAAPLPPDLGWASGRPAIASAFARAAATVDAAGARSVPEPARRVVADRLAAGDQPPLNSRSWLDEAVRPLDPHDRPTARLALLAATGSYLVTDALVNDFLAQGHGEEALIDVTAWGSMAAARTVGARLQRQLARMQAGP